jgi:general secretion pathway protein H
MKNDKYKKSKIGGIRQKNISFTLHPSVFYLKPFSSGFTLIEIIIVLFIIGIASGLVGILISRGSGSLEIRTFTKDVSSVLRYARNHAVSEKRQYCFVIDINEDVYRLYTTDTSKDEEDEETVLVISKSIPEELQMTVKDSDTDSPYIEFFPWGNTSGGVIEITNRKGSVFFIIVNRITGRLEVGEAE